MASAAQDMQIAKDPWDAACSGARVRLALASPSSPLRASVNFCVGKLT
jgi:hypothetical protein